MRIILADLTIDLNAEFEDEGGEDFDFKAAFKAPNSLRNLSNRVVSSHKKLIARGRTESFSQLWNRISS